MQTMIFVWKGNIIEHWRRLWCYKLRPLKWKNERERKKLVIYAHLRYIHIWSNWCFFFFFWFWEFAFIYGELNWSHAITTIMIPLPPRDQKIYFKWDSWVNMKDPCYWLCVYVCAHPSLPCLHHTMCQIKYEGQLQWKATRNKKMTSIKKGNLFK